MLQHTHAETYIAWFVPSLCWQLYYLFFWLSTVEQCLQNAEHNIYRLYSDISVGLIRLLTNQWSHNSAYNKIFVSVCKDESGSSAAAAQWNDEMDERLTFWHVSVSV